MDDGGNPFSFESSMRAAWASLIAEELPAAARARGWPVKTPEAFERILLDRATGRAACTKSAGLFDIALAVEIGALMLEGEICPQALDQSSRALRSRNP